MCGRFVSASTAEDLAQYFGAQMPDQELDPSYNVAPTSEVYVVRASEGNRELATVRWGLIPFWAKDPKIGSKMVNARSETALEKPAFRDAVRKRRCIIPADGFYEWAKVDGHKRKQPYYIHRVDGEPLAFAGLWERWRPPADPDGEGREPVETCTILTCSPNETMGTIHNRMPVLLPPQVWDDWLAGDDDLARLAGLLVPAPDGLLELKPVTTVVNSVRNNGPELLAVDPEPLVAVGWSGDGGEGAGR